MNGVFWCRSARASALPFYIHDLVWSVFQIRSSTLNTVHEMRSRWKVCKNAVDHYVSYSNWSKNTSHPQQMSYWQHSRSYIATFSTFTVAAGHDNNLAARFCVRHHSVSILLSDSCRESCLFGMQWFGNVSVLANTLQASAAHFNQGTRALWL